MTNTTCYREKVMKWDHDDIRTCFGKQYMLRFLPYIQTPDGEDTEFTIGYRPRRGYRAGRFEECFHTLAEARARMKFLIDAQAIEDAEIRKAASGPGMMTTLVDEWRDEPGEDEDE